MYSSKLGTGKTTTARKLGQVFYDLRLLSQVEVVECSVSDLIGQYIGQTGPKTSKQLERGLGKVLFIDEAYRLGEGHFATEAISELVNSLTKTRFAGKLIVILAGYDKDMDALMQVNEGLSSRFTDEIIFSPLSAKHCFDLLLINISKKSIECSILNTQPTHKMLLSLLGQLCELPSWGNARDIQTLAKSMVRKVFQTIDKSPSTPKLSSDVAISCVEAMLSERQKRSLVVPKNTDSTNRLIASMDMSRQSPPPLMSTRTSTRSAPPEKEADEPEIAKEDDDEDSNLSRDPGVSDAIWAQLQIDKDAAFHREEKHQQSLAEKAALLQIAEKEQAARVLEAQRILRKKANDEAEAERLENLRKIARIQEANAAAEKERLRLEHEKMVEVEKQKKIKEAKAQQKLKALSVCPQGFLWTKQVGGYRCGGGSHWVSDGQLGLS
jgi:hypothetical protein